jgi:succinate-acetate transporter protein
MEEKIANPAPLGLAAFGLTTLVLNIVNAGIVSADSIGMVLPLGMFYGGIAQFAAGMWEFKKGNTFGSTAFTSFAAFWIALSTMILLENTGIIASVPKGGMAVFLIVWGIFAGYMFICTLKLTRTLQIAFITLTILFFLLAAGEFNPTIHKIAGYEGIICALSALYGSAAIVINETWGRDVLPL